MTIEFNKINKYDLFIGKNLPKESKEAKEAGEVKEAVNYETFKGLENETDLLTASTQDMLGVKIGKFTADDKDLADKTNEILASLGYDYRVSATQVASVTNGLKTVVLPGMQLAENGAVAAHIQDPNGPFADLFV
jgi:hypothetical protein